MIDRPDAAEIAGLAGLALLIAALAPLIERAKFVFACFDIIQGRLN